MRGLLWAAGLYATAALAQPADCPTLPPQGPGIGVSVDLAGRAGVPGGTTGKAFVPVPMQAPQTDCGEPSAPSDVLHGEPGDLLSGTPATAPEQR